MQKQISGNLLCCSIILDQKIDWFLNFFIVFEANLNQCLDIVVVQVTKNYFNARVQTTQQCSSKQGDASLVTHFAMYLGRPKLQQQQFRAALPPNAGVEGHQNSLHNRFVNYLPPIYNGDPGPGSTKTADEYKLPKYPNLLSSFQFLKTSLLLHRLGGLFLSIPSSILYILLSSLSIKSSLGNIILMIGTIILILQVKLYETFIHSDSEVNYKFINVPNFK